MRKGLKRKKPSRGRARTHVSRARAKRTKGWRSAGVSLALGLMLTACSSVPARLPVPADFPVHGIDVSKYQGEIDWETAKRGGVSFAWIKATEGGDHSDEAFARNWVGARRAGVARGAYHFWYFCRTGAEQVEWFKQHVPVERDALPPVIDMEWVGESKTCRRQPPREEVLREMRVALAELERHYGKRPIIYVSVDFHRDRLEHELHGHPFWVRSVAGYPTIKYDRRKWTFWQYTGTGRVPGIRGEVDRNVFAGSPKDFKKWFEGTKHHKALERF